MSHGKLIAQLIQVFIQIFLQIRPVSNEIPLNVKMRINLLVTLGTIEVDIPNFSFSESLVRAIARAEGHERSHG